MSAGKGDKLRVGANLKKYWENYDEIFRKQPRKTIKQWREFLNHKEVDFDTALEYNSDDLLTQSEYEKIRQHE